jgi:hypothetical protein
MRLYDLTENVYEVDLERLGRKITQSIRSKRSDLVTEIRESYCEIDLHEHELADYTATMAQLRDVVIRLYTYKHDSTSTFL